MFFNWGFSYIWTHRRLACSLFHIISASGTFPSFLHSRVIIHGLGFLNISYYPGLESLYIAYYPDLVCLYIFNYSGLVSLYISNYPGSVSLGTSPIAMIWYSWILGFFIIQVRDLCTLIPVFVQLLWPGIPVYLLLSGDLVLFLFP